MSPPDFDDPYDGQDPFAAPRSSRSQASAWIAALRRHNRNPAVEADFRTWLTRDPSNPRTFDAATQIWELLGAAGMAFRTEHRRKVLRRTAITASAACFIVLVGVGAGVVSQAVKRRKLSPA